MERLPLNALRAFAAVYHSGGIRPAGRLLGVSHSSIARHVSELEAALGVPLIERSASHRLLKFTGPGETLGKRAAKSLDELEITWTSLKERRSNRSVVISTTPSVASLWLLPRLPKLAEALPKVEVSVLTEQRLVDVSEGRYDLAIRMGGDDGDHIEPLMDDALVPVASPRLLDKTLRANLARVASTALVALFRDYPLLHDRDPNAGWDLWFREHVQDGIDTLAGPRFTSTDLVLRAAKLGQGIALARLRLAASDLEDGSLIRLSSASVRLQDAYKLISGPEQAQRRSVAEVRHWLLEEAASDGPCA